MEDAKGKKNKGEKPTFTDHPLPVTHQSESFICCFITPSSLENTGVLRFKERGQPNKTRTLSAPALAASPHLLGSEFSSINRVRAGQSHAFTLQQCLLDMCCVTDMLWH